MPDPVTLYVGCDPETDATVYDPATGVAGTQASDGWTTTKLTVGTVAGFFIETPKVYTSVFTAGTKVTYPIEGIAYDHANCDITYDLSATPTA